MPNILITLELILRKSIILFYLFTIVKLTSNSYKSINNAFPNKPAIPVPEPHPEIEFDGNTFKNPITTDSPKELILPHKLDPISAV